MALLNTNIGPERVQVFDVPVGAVQIAGAATSVTAFLVSSSLMGAPVNSPTRIQSFDEFVDAFGDADDLAFDGYYAVKGYYDNAGTGADAIIVNVGVSPTANSFIGNAAAGTGLRALDAIDDVGLVCIPGLPLSMAYLVYGPLIDYSETVRTEFGATLSTMYSLMSVPKEITRANTSTTLVTGQLQAITGTGPWTMDIQMESTAVAASGTATISAFANLVSGTADTIQVAGITFTAQAGAATPGTATFQAATSNDATATSLADQINAHAGASALVSASATTNVVTITALQPGAAGNTYTLVYTDNDAQVGASVSGSGFLAGGVDGNLDLSVVTPGMIVQNLSASYTGVISAVNNTTDSITVTPNPTAAFSPGDDVLIKMPSAIAFKDTVINNPSRVSAWYYNSAVVLDESASATPGETLVIDPVGHVAGVMARIDSNIAIGGPSHAPAGIQYAGLAGIVGLSLAISERVDAEPLRLAWINRITSFPGAGNIIFGGYSAGGAAVTADEQLIQVMRTLQYIKASLEPGLRGFIWENFSPETQSQVERAIESFLRNNVHLFPAGLPENQQFRVLRVEATQNDLDVGLLRVRVLVKPNKAVRFIEVALEFPLPTA